MTEKAREEWHDNVVPMPVRQERPLSDDELVRIRVMLRRFEQISQECPMARRLLFDEN